MSTVALNPITPADDELAKLRSIPVSAILEQRYGAEKDGPPTQSIIRSTGVSGTQQKYRLAKGHHINVLGDGTFFDLLEKDGGKGSIDLVVHLEGLTFLAAKKQLLEWYPDYSTFRGRSATPSGRPSPVPGPRPAKVLPRVNFSTGDRRESYSALVRDYLINERRLPAQLVEEVLNRNLAYPVEKTVVQLVDNPGSRELVTRMRTLASAKNYQFRDSDRDTTGQGPLLIFHQGKRVPGIRARMETRGEFLALLNAKHEFQLPGSPEVYRPAVAKVWYQPEVAFPILKFGTSEPVATSLRALKGTHKQVLGPKSEGAFVVGRLTPATRKLVLTESPIEALCYYALKKPPQDTCIYGLSGSGGIEPIYSLLKENDVEIVNAFNNEGAGRVFASKVHESAGKAGIRVRDEFPERGEISIEFPEDESNKKHLALLRDTARQNRVRFMEKIVPSNESTGPQRIRMRIESHAEIWKLLSVSDPAQRRRMFSPGATKETEGVAHFVQTAEIEPICKDWNDVLKGYEGTVFFPDFSRTFDRNHSYMAAPTASNHSSAPGPSPEADDKTGGKQPTDELLADGPEGPEIGI